MMNDLLELIAARDLEKFIEEWGKIKESVDPAQRQEFLTTLIAFTFDDREFSFFEKVLDRIIPDDFDLNFHIEHWAPTLLSLSVHVVSQSLFDYLLSKGADINFVGDPYAFEEDDYLQNELKLEDRRYSTCLDFGLLKLSEMMGSDYTYQRPDWTGVDAPWAEVEPGEEVTVSKRYYAYLVEQSQYLYELINLHKLIEHIQVKGGKRYSQLK